MLTLKKLNKEIALPLGATLVKGEGYFYLIGNVMEYAQESSIYVCNVNHLSYAQWKENIEALVKDAKARELNALEERYEKTSEY